MVLQATNLQFTRKPGKFLPHVGTQFWLEHQMVRAFPFGTLQKTGLWFEANLFFQSFKSVTLSDLEILCSGSFSHLVKSYSFMFLHKISTRVVCVNGKHPSNIGIYCWGASLSLLPEDFPSGVKVCGGARWKMGRWTLSPASQAQRHRGEGRTHYKYYGENRSYLDGLSERNNGCCWRKLADETINH